MLVADHIAIPSLASQLNILCGPTISPGHLHPIPLSDTYNRHVHKKVLCAVYEFAKEGVFGADVKEKAEGAYCA